MYIKMSEKYVELDVAISTISEKLVDVNVCKR